MTGDRREKCVLTKPVGPVPRASVSAGLRSVCGAPPDPRLTAPVGLTDPVGLVGAP